MADAALLEAIRAILSGCLFYGEGHRKVCGPGCAWAGCAPPSAGCCGLWASTVCSPLSRVGSPKGPRNHDGTIIPDRVDAM